MSRLVAALPVAFIGLALAGCLEDAPPAGGVPLPEPVTELLVSASTPALWNDPQLASHPSFGWPTLTQVPAGAPALWQPIPARPLPDPVMGLEHVASAGSGTTGDGIAVFGRLAVNAAGVLFDITNPAKPEVLFDIDVRPAGRQATLLPFPDGKLYALFATGSGYVPIWDVTDPKAPTEVTSFKVPSGGHTIAIVPGTPILYNANAVGSRYYPHEVSGGRSISQVEIYDLSSIDTPKLVKEWKNGYGCHAISFWHNAEANKFRAYCAAVDATQIWDIADPLAPVVLSTIPMPHGQSPAPGYPILVAVSHYVVVNDDATVMGVADEFLGGAGPGCDAYVRQQGRTVSGPAGNVYFYDIRNERAPVVKGWVNPGAHFTYNPAVGACTAHIGRMIPQEKHDLMAMSFYAGGVALIDFTEPTNPFITAAWQQRSPMDVWYYNGYLFAGDASRGIDVLTPE